MARTLMAICVLVAFALPRFVHGRPATNDTGSTSNILVARGSKLEGLSNYEQEEISSIVQGSTSISARSRQRRLSDQRRAELETLMTLSRMRGRLIPIGGNKQGYRKLDLMIIGRRRRSTTSLIPSERLARIHRHSTVESRHNGDPAYHLIS